MIERLDYADRPGKHALSVAQALQVREEACRQGYLERFTCASCGCRATVHSGRVPLHAEHLPTEIVAGKRRLSERAQKCSEGRL